MAGETFIKGDVQIVYIYDASAYEPIACLTDNEFSSSLAVNELNTKCDPGNTIQTAGAFSYSISGSGLSIDTGTGGDTSKQSHEALFAYQQAKTLITWKIDTGLATDTARYGTGYITDLSEASPTGSENSTFTFTISGSGAVVTVDPNA